MRDSLLLLGVFATAYGGFTLLALSQIQHWRQVAGSAPLSSARVIVFRVAGTTLIAFSLALSLLRDGASFGALLWATGISLTALAVAFTLAWRPAWLRPLTLLGTRLATRCSAGRS